MPGEHSGAEEEGELPPVPVEPVGPEAVVPEEGVELPGHGADEGGVPYDRHAVKVEAPRGEGEV